MPRGSGSERVHKVIERKVGNRTYYVMFLPKDWVTAHGVRRVRLTIQGAKILLEAVE